MRSLPKSHVAILDSRALLAHPLAGFVQPDAHDEVAATHANAIVDDVSQSSEARVEEDVFCLRF